MRKIILVLATFITVAGIAFAASCYKYHYVLRGCLKSRRYGIVKE